MPFHCLSVGYLMRGDQGTITPLTDQELPWPTATGLKGSRSAHVGTLSFQGGEALMFEHHLLVSVRFLRLTGFEKHLL